MAKGLHGHGAIQETKGNGRNASQICILELSTLLLHDRHITFFVVQIAMSIILLNNQKSPLRSTASMPMFLGCADLPLPRGHQVNRDMQAMRLITLPLFPLHVFTWFRCSGREIPFFLIIIFYNRKYPATCLTSKTQTVYSMIQFSNNRPQQPPLVRKGAVLALFPSLVHPTFWPSPFNRVHSPFFFRTDVFMW